MKEEEQKVKEEETKEEVKNEEDKEKERRVSLSDAVLQEYEEVQKENKRLHNMITELHKKHHDISIKVNQKHTIERTFIYLTWALGRCSLFIMV